MSLKDKIDLVVKYIKNKKKQDPCWDGYKQIGMKKKGNKEVPNCVPVKKYAKEEIVPPFYSHARKVIESKVPAKGSSEQVLKTLLNSGVKPEELKWSGLESLLNSKSHVTKEELLDNVSLPVLNEIYHDNYGEYKLPGGKNYREILFQLDNPLPLRAFTGGGHWEEPNILSHMRMHDYVGPKGEKLLHLEELQSDWHQKGRDKGYREPLTNYWEVVDKYHKLKDTLKDKELDLYIKVKNHQGELFRKINSEDFASPTDEFSTRNLYSQISDIVNLNKRVFNDERLLTGRSYGDLLEGLSPHIRDMYRSRTDLIDNLRAEAIELDKKIDLHNAGVSHAPLKKTWHEHLLKHAIRHAAENGYDGITWTPGDLQSARYGRANPEGMKGFYDKIVPDYLNKLGKRHGVKVSKTTIDTTPSEGEKSKESHPTSLEVPYFPVNESMKKEVLHEGQTFYSLVSRAIEVLRYAKGNKRVPNCVPVKKYAKKIYNPDDVELVNFAKGLPVSRASVKHSVNRFQDSLPHLVFADYLEERGHVVAANHIREVMSKDIGSDLPKKVVKFTPRFISVLNHKNTPTVNHKVSTGFNNKRERVIWFSTRIKTQLSDKPYFIEYTTEHKSPEEVHEKLKGLTGTSNRINNDINSESMYSEGRRRLQWAYPDFNPELPEQYAAKGKNPEGGLTVAEARKQGIRAGSETKAAAKKAGGFSKIKGKTQKRRESYCSRGCGQLKKAGAKTRNDPDSRINKALRIWGCRCGARKKALLNTLTNIKYQKLLSSIKMQYACEDHELQFCRQIINNPTNLKTYSDYAKYLEDKEDYARSIVVNGHFDRLEETGEVDPTDYHQLVQFITVNTGDNAEQWQVGQSKRGNVVIGYNSPLIKNNHEADKKQAFFRYEVTPIFASLFADILGEEYAELKDVINSYNKG